MAALSVEMGCQAWYWGALLSVYVGTRFMTSTYAVVGALMHVNSLKSNRGRVRIEFDAL